MKIIQAPSPNFGSRKDCVKPSVILLHYTGMKTGEKALMHMCDPDLKVSSHYMIEEDGQIFQLEEEDQRAWHAGEAYWAGEHDINSHSIGIELVNPGHEFGYRSFPQEQIDNLITLCKVIIDRYGISQKNILGHSDVAPKRKYDPGELFPWKSLSEKGIGIWPKVLDMDIEAGRDLIIETPDSFHELLCVLGYDPDIEFDSVVMAFHRHFYPEKFITGDYPYIPDNQSAARLLALMRAVHICDA